LPDSVFELHVAAPADNALLFGDEASPPLWLWLALEPEEVERLEGALLGHLRSPLFPARIGERPVRRGDDAGLLAFAAGFAPLAPRFAGGLDLLLAATRIVAERGGPLCREGALACIEALQHRQHAEARSLGDASSSPTRLRRFVLAARLSADLWLRFLPGPESGRTVAAGLAEVVGAPTRAFAGIAEAVSAAPDSAHAPSAPAAAPDGQAVTVLQPFEPPNDRAEWQSYQPLAAPLPLCRVPRDASRRLAALAEAAPAFTAPLAEIRRTLALAAHAGRPSPRLRPLLLVGPPGVGKTWFARRVAQALELPFASFNHGGATDNRCLQGTARG
jgi:ATPase family protein associated with various cellular activities (AAA)